MNVRSETPRTNPSGTERPPSRSQPSKAHSDLICRACNKKGHIARNCRSKQKNEQTTAATANTGSTSNQKKAFPVISETFITNGPDHHWLGDTGASVHVASDRSIFRDYQESSITEIKGAGLARVAGTGNVDIISTIGDKKFEFTLTNVLHVPSLQMNLISLGQMEKAGYALHGEGG